jgi:hypothetical protein
MNEKLSHETALFVVSVFAIIVAALMGFATQIIIALLSVLSLLLMVNVGTARKLMGYGIALDLLFGVAVASIAAGTLGGLYVIIAAGMVSTLIRLELTAALGSVRLSVNGETGFVSIAKQVWQRLTGKVAKLTVAWSEHTPAGGFAATNTGKASAWLLGQAGVGDTTAWVKPAAFAAAGAATAVVAMQMATVVLLTGVAIAAGAAFWYLRPRTQVVKA